MLQQASHWAGTVYPCGAPEFTPGFDWGSRCSIGFFFRCNCLQIIIFLLGFFLLIIVLPFCFVGVCVVWQIFLCFVLLLCFYCCCLHDRYSLYLICLLVCIWIRFDEKLLRYTTEVRNTQVQHILYYLLRIHHFRKLNITKNNYL